MSKRKQRLGRYEPVRFMQQNPDATPNTYGATPEDPVEYIRRKALVTELRGTEKVIDGQLQADSTHMVYMHGMDNAAKALTPQHHLLRTSVNNERLDIIWVRNVGTDGMEIEILCNNRKDT